MSDDTIRDIKITPALKSTDPQSFIAWRASAKLQLGIHGLLKYVESPRDGVLATLKTDTEKQKGVIDDMRAALAIQSSLGGDQAYLAHEYETAYGKRKALNDQFMRESNARAVALRSKLNRLQPRADGSDIESYLHELQMIYAELAANGRAVQEQDKVQKVLDDLPTDLLYIRSHIMGLDFKALDTINFQDVANKVRSGAKLLKQKRSRSSRECGEHGHIHTERPSEGTVTFKVAKTGIEMEAMGVGTLLGKVNGAKVGFSKVYHVPGASRTLISEGHLLKNGFKVNKGNGKFQVKDNHTKVVFAGKAVGDIFPFKITNVIVNIKDNSIHKSESQSEPQS
ncbi:hypothetical protein GGF31_007305 [Allomyces arbusculus]|nr:hypothetical protein GGF31_007305 [Allomyces arbusculus]